MSLTLVGHGGRRKTKITTWSRTERGRSGDRRISRQFPCEVLFSTVRSGDRSFRSFCCIPRDEIVSADETRKRKKVFSRVVLWDAKLNGHPGRINSPFIAVNFRPVSLVRFTSRRVRFSSNRYVRAQTVGRQVHQRTASSCACPLSFDQRSCTLCFLSLSFDVLFFRWWLSGWYCYA